MTDIRERRHDSRYFLSCPVLFFFNDPATTEIYTLSLHDALPILRVTVRNLLVAQVNAESKTFMLRGAVQDRKSTRLNSSHEWISYAVFCLKKKTTRPNSS